MLKRTDYSKPDNYAPTFNILTATIGESSKYNPSFNIQGSIIRTPLLDNIETEEDLNQIAIRFANSFAPVWTMYNKNSKYFPVIFYKIPGKSYTFNVSPIASNLNTGFLEEYSHIITSNENINLNTGYKPINKSINILFYGNCQLNAILKTLNLSNNYNIFHIECWGGIIDHQYFTDIIKKCDIIITQSINDNYRNVDYLSTNYIKQHKKLNCKLIIFDSCVFNFYYFDTTYKNFNNDILHVPIDYHYNKMIECYNNGYSIDYYINNFVNNLNLKSSEELEAIAGDSLNELYNRFINNKIKYNDNNIYIISIYEYIKQNYKEKLLFYSMNHPTKYVIQYICHEIIKYLKIENTINYDIDVLNNPKCILYKCISKNVNFDINNDNTITLNSTNINTITQLYYDTYKKIGFK